MTYRLVIAVSCTEMEKIEELIKKDFPEIAEEIKKQRLEIQNTGVNTFGNYKVEPNEDKVGLSDQKISHIPNCGHD